jgi:integrase
MGGAEVEAYLCWLSAERGVAVATHRQALSALLFLYGKVLGQDLPWMQSIGRPQRKARLPVVLSVDEVGRVLALLDGEQRLFAQLLYGTGLRITEGLQLRVKDVDFEHRTLIVRAGKGGKDRAVMLPAAIVPALHDQFARARRGIGFGSSHMPRIRPIRARASCAAITCSTTRLSSALSSEPWCSRA